MRMRTILAVGATLTMGCSALIGVRDIYLDENAEGGVLPDGGRSDAPVGTDGSSGDGATCTADVRTDPMNCGRCGRDCLGGACKDGACEPIVLASNLTNPSSALPTATSLIVTTYGDGRILEVSKMPGGTPREIRTGEKSPWGVFIDGTTLYWANADYAYNGTDPARKGGVWKCTLPACTDPKLVTPGDDAMNPAVAGGTVYFAENNNSAVTAAQTDGGARRELTSASNPHSIALDATHLYYTASQASFYRLLLADGGSETVGPQGYYAPGGIFLDAERFYYTYTDDKNQVPGAGHVVSFRKQNAQDKIEYGGDNVVPRGIVADDRYVYWANSGTFDEVSGAPSHFDGEIRACPKAGCAPTGPIVLAKGLGRPWEMNQDERAIYVCVYGNYAQAGGSVLKIPKL